MTLRVLVAEDDRVNQRLMHKMLQTFGCDVTLVGDGATAIAAARRERYDLVLMDCMMPVLDGVQATRVLRADPRLAAMTIVAVTANASDRHRQQCLDAGMNDHLAKPIRLQALRELVAREAAKRPHLRSA